MITEEEKNAMVRKKNPKGWNSTSNRQTCIHQKLQNLDSQNSSLQTSGNADTENSKQNTTFPASMKASNNSIQIGTADAIRCISNSPTKTQIAYVCMLSVNDNVYLNW